MEAPMPRRKDRPRLTVRVSFEATRLSPQCLIEAYERLAPTQRRPVRAARSATPVDEVRTMPDRGGNHG
jgi:transcriptional regulator of nitric oxide reductase